MRIIVKLEAKGSTLGEVIRSLDDQWESFSGLDGGLPYDSEVNVEPSSIEGTYVATCVLRAKRDR